MADDLAAVVLRETDVDPDRLDEAVQRQVLSGGGLDTILLEMGLIDEDGLLPLLEKVHGLPAVGRDDIARIDPGAVAVFPQRLAEKHGIVPLELSGRRLSVAVAKKPDLNLLDEIGFMLSVYVRPFITTEARLAYGLMRLYRVALPPRIENLLGMLGEDPESEIEAGSADSARRGGASADEGPGGARALTAVSDGAPDPDSEDLADLADRFADFDDDETLDLERRPAFVDDDTPVHAAGNGGPAGPWKVEATGRAAMVTDAAVPEFRLAPATSESVLLSGGPPRAAQLSAESMGAEAAVLEREQVPFPAAAPARESPAEERASPSPSPPPPAPDEAAREEMRKKLLAEVDAREAEERHRAEARRKERVRWTVDDAIAELALATDRDAMVDVVLRFAHRRLTTVAMLVVHKDHFSGWDIIDPKLDRDAFAKVQIPARGDHVLAKLREMRSPFLGPFEEVDPLARVLGRQPRAALLVPVMVEDKLAAVLYGDCGKSSIPPSSLAELHMVAPRFGKGLRNLILRGKRVIGPDEVAAEDAAAEPFIEPAAKPIGSLPVIELDIEDFDEVVEQAAARAPPAPPKPPADDDVDVDPIEAALDEMSSASEGSFAPLDRSADGRSAVAGVVGVHVDIEEEPAAELEVSAADIEDAEDLTELGARRRAALEADETEIEFSSIDGAADDRTRERPPPIPKQKKRAKNRGPDTPRSTVVPAPPPAAPAEEPAAEEPAAEEPAAEEPAAEEPAADEPAAEEPAAEEPAAEERAAEELAAEEPAAEEPAAEEPAAEEPAAEEPAAEEPAAEEPAADDARPPRDGVTLPAPSPGAQARESILVATWREWMAYEDPDLDDQLAELQAPGEAGRAAVARVVSEGDRAMPSLARYFPGVLAVHPFGHVDQRPDVRDFSDALACLVRLGADRAAPLLIAEVNHEDRLHRYAAIWALSELRVPAALARLTQRVFDPEYRIALLVLDVLEAYRDQPQFPKVLERLRDLTKRGNEFERKRAIQAVCELRDREALPILVDLLGTRPKDIAEEARRALVEITKQDFGQSGRRWRAWITDHKDLRRTEWLILGLANKDENVRAGAQAELNQLTGHYHGYRFDAPRAERDLAIQQWKQWWTTEADPSAYP